MNTFVQGTIIEQDGFYGDYYEMKLRLATGQVIPLNYNSGRDSHNDEENGGKDEIDPISDLLELGASYELLTVLELRHMTYSPTVPAGTVFKLETKNFQGKTITVHRNEIRQGKVLDLDWNVASMDYLALSNARISEQHYALLETAIGKVLLNHREIEFELGEQSKQLAVDGYLEWQRGGLLLIAIIDKQPPKAEEDTFSGFDGEEKVTRRTGQEEGDTFRGFDAPSKE